MPLKISECESSKKWLSQFEKEDERILAAKMLDNLKYVSLREFEISIIEAVKALQARLKRKLAVYPIIPAYPKEVSDYDLFTGGISGESHPDTVFSRVGKRRQYGSEDRVGHILSKLNEGCKVDNKTVIEITPTLTQLKTQKIIDIVLIDDMCGSGKRIHSFWKKCIPKSIKSQLSYKKLNLWIILYGATSDGLNYLRDNLRGFPHDTNILVCFQSLESSNLNFHEIQLCQKYSFRIYGTGSGLGFSNSYFPVVFEHGCPNNLPPIFWESSKKWTGIFPGRLIPPELREFFENNGLSAALNSLSDTRNTRLALSILEKIEENAISHEFAIILLMLGMVSSGIPRDALHARTYQRRDQCELLLSKMNDAGLIQIDEYQITDIGRHLLEKFKNSRRKPHKPLEKCHQTPYIPTQCEGGASQARCRLLD